MNLAPGVYGPPDPNAQADPSAAPAEYDTIDAILHGMQPNHLSDLDALLGIEHPQLDTSQEALPPQSVGQQIVGGFSGLENQPQGPAQGFGQGLVQGLSRGLGGAGTRANAMRAKLEAQVAQRQQTKAALNAQATRDYRTELSSGRRALALAAISARGKAASDKAAGDRESARDASKQALALSAERRANAEWSRRHDVEVRDKEKSGGAPKPPTAAQQQGLAFYNRASGAVATIYNPATRGGIEDSIASMKPIDQFALRAPNVMQSPAIRQYNNAKRIFATAILRKESGAAINQGEYDSIDKAYFVQPGDDMQTIRQKRDARQVALDGLKLSAAPQMNELTGQSSGDVVAPSGPAAFWRP